MMCLHSNAGIFIHSSVKIAEIKIIRVVFYVSSLTTEDFDSSIYTPGYIYSDTDRYIHKV